MPSNRRTFIQQSIALSAYASLFSSAIVSSKPGLAAWQEEDFARGSLSDALIRLYSGATLTESDQIILKLPQVAENGAVVPISVTSTLPKVTDITIFVAKNPTPLTASFKLSPDVDAFVSTRIKMAETSDVIAVVTSDDKLYTAKQEVQVTIGGCGG